MTDNLDRLKTALADRYTIEEEPAPATTPKRSLSGHDLEHSAFRHQHVKLAGDIFTK